LTTGPFARSIALIRREADEGPSREQLVDPPHRREDVIVIGGRPRTVDAGSRHAEQRALPAIDSSG
jgi:hypothetical protein